jgi:hypothetical protein
MCPSALWIERVERASIRWADLVVRWDVLPDGPRHLALPKLPPSLVHDEQSEAVG